MKPKILFLVGPTAVGKSEVAARLAKKINAEIISCDSMQLYKGMDIITSKPAPALRKMIKHHLLGTVSPLAKYDVSRYRQDALIKVKEIIKKGKIPLFVGGTGLYMSIVIDGIFKAGPMNKQIRALLYKQVEKFGSGYLYAGLKKVDPEAAAKIHPHDTKRLIRALEVFQATGRPISLLQKQRVGLDKEYTPKIFCLNMPRQDLYLKIERRIDKMFRQGLLNEVRRLVKLKLSRTASSAIGIKELKGYLEGAYDLKEAKRLLKRNTRLYAKRQLTWFRKDKRINWIEVGVKEKPGDIAMRIWKELY
jgi:tRNA dimethylallyltransferase